MRPPGPGPTSITVTALQRAGRAGDLLGQVEIEQEVLAERLFRIKPMALVMTSRSGGRPSSRRHQVFSLGPGHCRPISWAIRKRCQQAVGAGDTLAGKAETAVP